MVDSEFKSDSFHLAELRSEKARVAALLGVFGALLLLVLIRGGMSLAEGRHGEAWPFAVLLAVMTTYEAVWWRFVSQATRSSRRISKSTWAASTFVESLLPTTALFLQIHAFGPYRALTSPTVLAFFFFIILSTLHLDPVLSWLTGGFSAAGYAAVSIYALHLLQGGTVIQSLLSYGTSFSYFAFLLLGGFTAGAVAYQIRLHVIAALREIESRAKIAEMEHDLDIARSIQQALLPKTPPQIAGFDIAGWNKPANETGGDYFDWQHVAEGRVALTVADVTGHGIGSALGMAACRAYARGALAAETDLRKFLGRLNQLLYADLPTEKFVTMAVGLLIPEESTLHLISAGHGPLLFYSSAEKCFRRSEAQGPPLGLLPRFNYGEAQIMKFAPGDILVLVTDGFIEWANAGDEDFGQNRLEEIVSTYRDMPSAGIISELYSSVLKFAGSTPQLDDLTALVVKRVFNTPSDPIA
jgi:serine phosphatase RsbU (regulator of sigma subunit)